MRVARMLSVLMLALALVGCASADLPLVTLGNETVGVYIVEDVAGRSQGLQGYDSLAPGEGMLFVFDDSLPRTFAMKGVSFPIDVLFIGDDMRVSGIERLEPGDTGTVTSPGPSPYVLELPAGWAADHDIHVGSEFVPPAG